MADTLATTKSFRPAQPTTMYQRNPFSSIGASPPNPTFRSDIFAPSSSIKASAQSYAVSPTAERHAPAVVSPLAANISDPFNFAHDIPRPAPAIVIRRLSRNIGAEALSSMLIFAGDLIDTELIRSPYPEDQGFATAVARFQSQAGALDAQQKLNGKANTTKEANMIVEIHSGGVMGSFERRGTVDSSASRTQTSSASSSGSMSGPPPRSRFGSTFQSSDTMSPSLPTSGSAGSGEFPVPETSAHFQNLFSPQSPLANGVDGRHRMSGKHFMANDAVDDETGELLKDPVAYARNGQQPLTRRPTNPQVPVSRFGSLSLSTSNGNGQPNGLASPTANGITSPHATPALHSPISPNNHAAMSPNGFSLNSYPRPQYPPVNPADQNPPCNTLYVGNLPIDTNEDELKTVFSKQRGYKRLCFRTKQNGPMCFVEFEDVSFATKALNELYGHPLSNSFKGGIRLSFSKNPLGVRSPQPLPPPGPNGLHSHHTNPAMNPHALSPGFAGAVSGPPPGLATPPGLMSGGSFRAPPPSHSLQPQTSGLDGMFANPFGIPQHDFASQLGGPQQQRNHLSGGIPPTMGGASFSRDAAAAAASARGGAGGWGDYMLGR